MAGLVEVAVAWRFGHGRQGCPFSPWRDHELLRVSQLSLTTRTPVFVGTGRIGRTPCVDEPRGKRIACRSKPYGLRPGPPWRPS